MRLLDQVAIVTGASRGIGRASSIALAREGAHLVLASRSEPELASLKTEIEKLGRKALVCVTDATKSTDVAACVKSAIASFGRIDILVNNTGVGGYRPFLEWTEEDYDRIMTTNVKSTWLFSREVLPAMRAQKRGHIINVASVAGLQGYPNEGIYCASKFAQLGLTQALDREFFQEGIKVSAICPGGTETHFALGDGRTAGSDHLKGFSTAEDVAEAVVMAALPRERTRIVNIIMRPMNEAT